MVSFRNQQDITSLQYAYGYFLAGDTVKGNQIAEVAERDCREQVDYYTSLSDEKAGAFTNDLQTAKQIISSLEQLKAQFSPKNALHETPLPVQATAPPPGAASSGRPPHGKQGSVPKAPANVPDTTKKK
jgi:hypothetical protein